jgi:hypothetical protein
MIPDDPAQVTLYQDGGNPCGTQGTVLLAGHVASKGVHGALWPLAGIRPNAEAWVTCDDGTPTRWRAVSADITDKADLPQDLFDVTGEHSLVIVTCGGDVTDGHYVQNVIAHFVWAGSDQMVVGTGM